MNWTFKKLFLKFQASLFSDLGFGFGRTPPTHSLEKSKLLWHFFIPSLSPPGGSPPKSTSDVFFSYRWSRGPVYWIFVCVYVCLCFHIGCVDFGWMLRSLQLWDGIVEGILEVILEGILEVILERILKGIFDGIIWGILDGILPCSCSPSTT